MDGNGRNLGGRAYLVTKLRGLGISRRQAVEILNLIFREMSLALRRGEYVEFPYGYLKAEKRLSERWEMIGDEPIRPYFIEHYLDEEGERLLEGETLPAWARAGAGSRTNGLWSTFGTGRWSGAARRG